MIYLILFSRDVNINENKKMLCEVHKYCQASWIPDWKALCLINTKLKINEIDALLSPFFKPPQNFIIFKVDDYRVGYDDDTKIKKKLETLFNAN